MQSLWKFTKNIIATNLFIAKRSIHHMCIDDCIDCDGSCSELDYFGPLIPHEELEKFMDSLEDIPNPSQPWYHKILRYCTKPFYKN